MMKRLGVFLLGLTAGLIIALLYAPQSGKKTRRRLRKQAKKWQLEMEARTEQGLERFGGMKESAEEMVEQAAKQVNGSTVNSSAINGSKIH